MRILVSGSSGYVSGFLLPELRAAGHEIVPLVRSKDREGIFWDPATGVLDPASVSGFDAVIHLAGAGIADKRWSNERKRVLVESRLKGTRCLAEALAATPKKPTVMLSASATGYYYPSDEVQTEANPPTSEWLARLCADWESAADPAREAGIRVVHPRISVVLGPGGGALKKMLPVFRMGMGGVLGSGKQWFSWITERDLAAAMVCMLTDERAEGAYNLAAPNPCTNRELTKALGAALKRPTVFPLPGFMVRLMFGEMGETLLLGSVRAASERLGELGFEFQDREIGSALGRIFGGVGDDG